MESLRRLVRLEFPAAAGPLRRLRPPSEFLAVPLPRLLWRDPAGIAAAPAVAGIGNFASPLAMSLRSFMVKYRL